jgi:antagonist of KipI
MTMPLFKILKPGLQTTVQDSGRLGYQQYGISPSGVMDSYSMKLANILIGNPAGEAVLEAAIVGPSLEALNDVSIAICGGDLQPMVNGQEMQMWKSFVLKKGEALSFGKLKSGTRAYISFAGGINVPLVLGSKSTFINGKLGGFNGRALETGDILYGHPAVVKNKFLHPDLIPEFKKQLAVRVILGPHLEKFTKGTIEQFFSNGYMISAQSNRMGYRLNGPKLSHLGGADIISDAIPLGGIQVPANGQPIILMAERQTTGGYARIATVISVDISVLAQAQPGSVIRFKKVSIEEAQDLYNERSRLFKCLSLGAGL